MPGSWSDFLELRSGADAPPPSPEAGDVRVYADGSGDLRSVQSDGTDAPIGGSGTPFNGGTITNRLEVDGAQDVQGLLKIHETAKTPGFYGLLVIDAVSNTQLATYTTPGGFPILILGGPNGVAAPLAVWADFDNDGTPGLSVDADHNAVVGASPGDGGKVGFYGASAVPQQTGVAVNAAAIHAALVNLGLITA